MKKVALLLGALALVSSVAYAKEVVPAVEEVVVVEEVKAAPMLRVDYVGQSIEVDNDSGTQDIGDSVHFGNVVGLSYGDDWTFEFFARKTWSMDTDDGINSVGHRLQLDAWRAFDNYSLGFRYRGESSRDKYYLRGKYNYGMFSGSLDVAYVSNNGSGNEDGIYIETTPIAAKIGPVTVGYYFEADEIALDTRDKDGFEHFWRHQLRLSAPLYQGEKLNVGLEYRWQFDSDYEYDGDVAYREQNENTHVVVLSAGYAVTDSLSISGYYQYDMKDFDVENEEADDYVGAEKGHANYYGEFGLGWTYTF